IRTINILRITYLTSDHKSCCWNGIMLYYLISGFGIMMKMKENSFDICGSGKFPYIRRVFVLLSKSKVV
ncbi:hypothetical protein, partial [Lentilactobacillus parakefiri]|uniref:hypothetical protein n=1 Tax=Lentilactobacillus parakefiri TaxID=152332 RepID=UPI001CDABC43